jgi:hypothetical protein
MWRPYRPRDDLLGLTWGDCPRLVWSCAVGAQEGSVVGRGRVQSLAVAVLVRRGLAGALRARGEL